MTDSQKWMVLGGIVVIAALIYSLSAVLMPFFIAALIAYMTDPIVNRLEKIGLNRTLAVMLVFVFLLALLVLLIALLIPLIESQIVLLLNTIPKIIAWIETVALPWMSQRFGINYVDKLQNIVGQASAAGSIGKAGDFLGSVFKTITLSGMALVGFVTNLVLIPVVGFYLLRDWGKLVTGVNSLLPRPIESTFSALVKECDDVVGAFFRGQLMVMASLAIIYSTGLWLVGLNLGLIIGLIAGAVSIVPYLGFIVGISAAVIAVLIQFHDVYHLILVLVVFAVGQTIESAFLTPVFVGDKIGLHPVAVIFAILAGAALFGFIGVLLALPVAAVIMVLIRYARNRYINSQIYAGHDISESET